MDHRCPACSGNLGRRKLSQAIVARMEMECAHCRRRIRLNIHPMEMTVVLLVSGAMIVLGALAYRLQSEALALLAFGAVMAGALAVPLLEHFYLRDWPRYTTVQ